MWDGFWSLLSFGTVMGGASFLAGSLPLSFGLSTHYSRIISAIGTGLLIGTCLIIIIPEGIGTLYSAQSYALERHARDPEEDDIIWRRQEHDHEHHDPHGWVGLALVIGFVMMYLIDQLPRHAANVTFRQKPMQISLADLSAGLHHTAATLAATDEDGRLERSEATPGTKATTLGLVIHAAADGIALAASTFITESSTGLIVFLALMIHKAPAAFGLTSVLLKQGLTKRQARAHLIVFSLAAPVGAFGTWILVNLVAGGHIEGEEGTRFATGLILLFSGGTFLYVAMHQMQEGGVAHDTHDAADGPYSNSHAFPGRSTKNEGRALELRDTLLAAVGMMLPLLAQVGHAH